MRDPLANPEPLVRRVYAYVAYRIGDGPDAEDVTNEVFERALRYRSSYDPSKGPPAAWLIGIARRVVDYAFSARPETLELLDDTASSLDVEAETLRRMSLSAALAELGSRDRELLALRYGADLKSREIAEILELNANAVDVGIHRALGRLRAVVTKSETEVAQAERAVDPAPGAVRISPERQ
jgi:RNA polymerase sigma factor (sigma-70 family)